MQRLLLAFRAFVGILLHGTISEPVAAALGLGKSASGQPSPAPGSASRPADGALQVLGILQRDSRLIDFLMEDLSAYSDDQVGAAVRSLHDECRQSLARYVQLAPVIDGVEGSFASPNVPEPGAVKFIGNVPAQGLPKGGILRHKGWRATRVDFPALPPGQDASIVAPAEIEIE